MDAIALTEGTQRRGPIAKCAWLWCATAILWSLAALAANADPTEVIVRTIDEREGEALALLERLVDVNSGTANFEGVREVGAILRAEFDALGFDTEWVGGAAFGRAGHLIARRGDSGPHFLLIGHLDTVFEPASPFQRFERIDEDHARGPGITDMKGGDVVILEVLRALDAAGPIRARFTVVLTGDEESSGRPLDLARRDLVEAAKDADYALGFEDGDGRFDTAVISRRGSTSWRVEVIGRPAHSSQVFTEAIGYGAIYEAARILDAFRQQLAGEAFATFNPGIVLGGTEVDYDRSSKSGTAFGKNNVVAEHAVITGDLRTLSREQLQDLRARMRAIVAESLPGTSASIVFADGYPPLAPTEANRALLQRLSDISESLGMGPVRAVDPMDAGAADVSFTSGHVKAALCGLGLMGTGGHTVEETADLRTLTAQAKRVALLIHSLVADGNSASE